jgi:dTDP-4-amino-4,6-dideoxygalactose transaminase
VDKYTWQEVGSSFLPGEMTAAFLWAQLEEAQAITQRRLAIWEHYHAALAGLERQGLLRRPIVPDDCQHNAHMYYVLLAPGVERQTVLEMLKNQAIYAVFHYVPLHSSPGGARYGRVHGSMAITDGYSERLLRLPIWLGLTRDQQDRVVEVLGGALATLAT